MALVGPLTETFDRPMDEKAVLGLRKFLGL